MKKIENVLDDLALVIQNVYEPAGLKVTQPVVREVESIEYGACRFQLNGQSIVFRVAKITPTKIGQFVTVWKRVAGKTAPFDIHDDIGFLVVSVSDATHRGQFVFDRKVLIAQGIFTQDSNIGKMAFRLYPPWTKPIAKKAIRSQCWQSKYFFAIASDGKTDLTQVRKLYTV